MRLSVKGIALLVVLSIFFAVGCGGDDENTQEGSGGTLPSGDWDNLTQLEKNKKILARAIEDEGIMVRQSCKVWVQHVVLDVTNGYWLPQNDTANNDRWIRDPHDRVFGWGAGFNSSTDITLADPGAIIQIRWIEGYASDDFKYNLHTAIVVCVSEDHIVFIESNNDDTPADASDAYANTRAITVSDFRKNVESFTVYYVR